MKKFLLLFTTLFMFQSMASNDVTHRPKSFKYSDAKAVFVDFQTARYILTYDLNLKQANVKAEIKFNVVEEGYPVFDLIPDPTSITINGKSASSQEISTPSNETTLRVLNKKLSPGSYFLEIKVPLTTLVTFLDQGVKNAFWVTDLQDRFYLERYIPVNLEYDRVKMTFELEFKGLKSPQHIFSNGKISWIDAEKVRIEYPEYFTVNSLYFHTTPVGTVELMEFTYTSTDGRKLPVAIYTAKKETAQITLNKFKDVTIRTLQELEGDYGPFPHSSVTIYNANLSSMGLGGMEYAGATVTDIGSLSHELTHSYFARGLVPANGNAGWIDEAIASWRDEGYDRTFDLEGTSRMASHPYYTRKTDTDAYGFGASFMSYLDGKFADRGGLKPFLNAMLTKKMFTPIFTEEFADEMSVFYSESVKGIFKTYVYGSSAFSKNVMKIKKHPVHRKMKLQDMQKIL